jgi:hypothetical protein
LNWETRIEDLLGSPLWRHALHLLDENIPPGVSSLSHCKALLARNLVGDSMYFAFCQWYLFYSRHHFRHPHVAVHLNRVGPMPTNPKLQLEFLLRWISHDRWHRGNFILQSPHSSLAIFPQRICELLNLHQMPNPLLSNVVKLWTRRKALHHTGSGWLPTPSATQPATTSMLDLSVNIVVELGDEKKGLALNRLSESQPTTHSSYTNQTFKCQILLSVTSSSSGMRGSR